MLPTEEFRLVFCDEILIRKTVCQDSTKNMISHPPSLKKLYRLHFSSRWTGDVDAFVGLLALYLQCVTRQVLMLSMEDKRLFLAAVAEFKAQHEGACHIPIWQYVDELH
jgi:hypothetical protein